MNYTTKTIKNFTIGMYVTFSLDRRQQFHVKTQESRFWVKVDITLPYEKKEYWAIGVATILRRFLVDCGWPVRLDYTNLSNYFSLEDMVLIERLNPATSFYMYNTPAKVANALKSTTLDIDQVVKNYNSTCRRSQRASHLTSQGG